MISHAAAQRRNDKLKFRRTALFFSLRRCAAAGVILLFALLPLRAQPSAQPERDQLLNGLRLLFFVKPGSPEVVLKLRINSGAAFDLSGKSGQMALLGDLLFPDPATLDYF